jgi:tRNA A37 threonylcarbamoyladenosine modification protein TsaB
MNEAYIGVFDKYLNTIAESHCRSYKTITQGLNEEYICVGDVHLIEDGNARFQKALMHQNAINAAAMFSLIKLKNIKITYDEEFISNIEPYYIRSSVENSKKS